MRYNFWMGHKKVFPILGGHAPVYVCPPLSDILIELIQDLKVYPREAGGAPQSKRAPSPPVDSYKNFKKL